MRSSSTGTLVGNNLEVRAVTFTLLSGVASKKTSGREGVERGVKKAPVVYGVTMLRMRRESRRGRQTGRRKLGERGGVAGGSMSSKDASDCLVVLGQCVQLEEPGGQEREVQHSVNLS